MSQAQESGIQKVFHGHYLVILFASVCIIIVSFGLVLWLPTWNSFRSGGEYDVSAKEQELSALEQNLHSLEVFSQNYDSIDDKGKDDILQFFPQNAEEGLIVAQLEQLAKDNGLILQSVDILEQDKPAERKLTAPSGATVDGNVTELLVKVSVKPVTYEAVKSFISGLEKHKRIFDVTAFQIQGSGEAAQIEMRTYYFSE